MTYPQKGSTLMYSVYLLPAFRALSWRLWDSKAHSCAKDDNCGATLAAVKKYASFLWEPWRSRMAACSMRA